MLIDPRSSEDYQPRQVEAAKRVIVDVMQVLASYHDCIVLVGGWVPELAIENPDEKHIGSIDVDLAVDPRQLFEGRYAAMFELLLKTGRYKLGPKDFQFTTAVDLQDGSPAITVEVDFLSPSEVKTEKNKPKLLEGFRILKADGCSAAFNSPLVKKFQGAMASGALNTVTLRIASIADFLVMKAFALSGRDKPKDAYDICFCLDNYEGGHKALAAVWKARLQDDPRIQKALEILVEKFATVSSYGPQQLVSFHNAPTQEIREQQSQRAYQLVQAFIKEIHA